MGKTASCGLAGRPVWLVLCQLRELCSLVASSLDATPVFNERNGYDHSPDVDLESRNVGKAEVLTFTSDSLRSGNLKGPAVLTMSRGGRR